MRRVRGRQRTQFTQLTCGPLLGISHIIGAAPTDSRRGQLAGRIVPRTSPRLMIDPLVVCALARRPMV